MKVGIRATTTNHNMASSASSVYKYLGVLVTDWLSSNFRFLNDWPNLSTLCIQTETESFGNTIERSPSHYDKSPETNY